MSPVIDQNKKEKKDFQSKILFKKIGRLYVDEINIKIGFLLGEYKHLTYFTNGFLRYIYYSTL